MTITDAAETVAILQTYWPKHPWNEHSALAFHMGLEDLEYTTVQQAVTVLVRTATFCPTPSEIRRQALSDRLESIPTAAEAWEEVSKQIRECGTRREYFFSHALIGRVVKALGWYLLVNSERPHQDRRDFMAMYTEFRDKQLRETMLDPNGPNAIPVSAGVNGLTGLTS